MAKAFVVRETFTLRDPENGTKTRFDKGHRIIDADLVKALTGSDHEHHLIPTTVSDAEVAAEKAGSHDAA